MGSRVNNARNGHKLRRISRRAFLKSAVGAGAGGGGPPPPPATLPRVNVARAQAPTVWKIQSTWPTRDIFHEVVVSLAQRVNEMSGGRLRFDVLPAGAVVPAFEVLDAVNRGVLDGGHGVPAYWFGKNVASSLFGTGPSFGMDAIDLLAWFYYGGGFDLYQELLQKELKMNVISFLHGPIPTQPLGWFRNPVLRPEQLQRTKYRTVGLSAELFKELGASVVILPGGEIVPALERGVIDGAEFNNPTSDKLLGFPDVRKVYMLQSYHQPVECLEILFNKTKWDALPADLKAIVRNAVLAESADFQHKMIDRNSRDLVELETQRRVRVFVTPRPVLEAQLKAWDVIIDRYSKQNPFFARVLQSQRAWARRVVSWKLRTYVDNRAAYEHYFRKR